MADNTPIAWAEATWNPTVGCTILTPGCTHCYAQREAARIAQWGGLVGPKYAGLTKPTKAGPVWTGEVRFWQPALDQPLRWARPRKIFVDSMSDLFHEDVKPEWFKAIWDVMVRARAERGHIFQILTKRPEIAIERVPMAVAGIWIGVSAEDTRRWDERIPLLRKIPNALPWVSVEPQLELIDREPKGLGWIVVGGESARPRSKARSFDIAWTRVMRDRCKKAGVPFFNKQLGSVAYERSVVFPTKHYAGADPEEWPADIRVREYPA
jgi:protein gp37